MESIDADLMERTYEQAIDRKNFLSDIVLYAGPSNTRVRMPVTNYKTDKHTLRCIKDNEYKN